MTNRLSSRSAASSFARCIEMSRVGKKPVPVPSGVSVTLAGQDLSLKGSKGELKLTDVPWKFASKLSLRSKQRRYALRRWVAASLTLRRAKVTLGFQVRFQGPGPEREGRCSKPT